MRSWLAFLLLSVPLLLPGQRPTAQDSAVLPPDAIRSALRSGAYDEAETLSRDLVTRLSSQGAASAHSVAEALDLLVAALVGNGKAAPDATFEAAARAVKMKEGLYGTGHLELAASLVNLGDVYVNRGEYQSGIEHHERALAIRESVLSENDPQVAASAERLALPLIRLERFDRAEALLVRALSIRERAADPLATARTLELLALLRRYESAYGDAGRHLTRALTFARSVDPDHPSIIALLALSGDLSFLAGDVAAARRHYDEAAAHARRTLRPDHPELVSIGRRIAATEWAMGNLLEARQLRTEMLRLAEAALAPCHPELTSLRGDLANSLAYDGAYNEARRLYESALNTFERCLGPTHSLTATGTHNLANLMLDLGDLREAERLHRRAISVWSARLGGGHSYVATGLDALAEVLMARKQFASAQATYQRALRVRRAALGAAHTDVAWTLANLARVTAARGDTALALKQLAEATAIHARWTASDYPDRTARLFELKGDLEWRSGDSQSARVSYAHALDARDRMVGRTHPLAAGTRAIVAALDFDAGAFGAALSGALEVEQVSRDHLRATVRYLPERQAMAYADARPRGLDLAMSASAAADVFDWAHTYDALVRSRGVVLDELIERVHSAEAGDPDGTFTTAIDAARRRYANLVVRSMQEPVPPDVLEDARSTKERAERALAEQSASARAERRRTQAGLPEMIQALPPQSALVSFVRFEQSRPRSAKETRRSRTVTTYGAFVLRADPPGSVSYVPIGPASVVEPIIRAWRAEAARHSPASVSAGRAYAAAGSRLRATVWDPIAARLAGASQAFIVQDGLLNVVNFAALPAGNGYLVESAPVLHYLSTERDLLAEGTTPQSRSALVVGGPDFGTPKSPQVAGGSRRSGCEAFGTAPFAALPESLREAEEITDLLSREAAADVTLLSGAGATETTLKLSVAGRRVVHLATHAYSLSAQCTPTAAGSRAVGAVVPAATPTSRVANENPLLLSGLAFAGANRRTSAPSALDDGMLTAEEIAGLNLQGTEWVVLSACDTGLGQIHAGEGVFGLRRAFQIAGARTVIMSLWQVDDEATRHWMRELYAGRLQRQLSTADAVREASLAILRARRDAGQSTHPFYWAAFIAAGDWQ